MREAEQALRQSLDGTIEAIGLTTEMRDPYTAGHQRRVTALAVAIAEELNLDRQIVEGIRAAGLMHDIGKMAVPAEILSKPSLVTDVEMSLIREHPQVAYDILKRATFPWPLDDIVLQHHERSDGSGYPKGLRADAIRLEARILAVADTVEAMASHRPYRASLGIDAALAEIEANRGTRYDADVVDACLSAFRDRGFEFSKGSDALG
ncbi:MAG: HD-GYP domain-containing protein [Candidatus Bipolaricaulia bacterium]